MGLNDYAILALSALTCFSVLYLGALVSEQQKEISKAIELALAQKCEAQNWTGYAVVGGCSGICPLCLCDEWMADCQTLKEKLKEVGRNG